MKILVVFVVSFCLFFLVISQDPDTTTDSSSNSTTSDGPLPPYWSYCFEFTWVGPAFDNITRFNQSCGEYLDSSRATNVPCSPPIVMTYDGTFPDIDYLFNNHQKSVLCKRTPSQVCARYTYKFAGTIQNMTFMCTQVSQLGKGPITSGCFNQKVRGYDVELCVCKSNRGIYKPCNGNV